MAIKEERARLLRWEACYNTRDLGGYRTADGRETRWGAVVRSDNLSRLTEAGRRAVLDYGIRTIVDLRMPRELAKEPSPFAPPHGQPGITYMNLSFLGEVIEEDAEEPASLAEDYMDMLDRFRREVATIMTAIARAPERGILVHCHAGKDRTGLIVALLLELAGVDRETIAADYALTIECLRPFDEEWLANGPGERAERERLMKKFAPRPEVMLTVLEHLERQYGGAEAYLLGSGVPAEDIERLRARLVDPQPQA